MTKSEHTSPMDQPTLKWFKPLIIAASGWCLSGCDPERKKECEWYLVPELEQKHLVSGEWVPLCARNYVTNKQKCYLTAKLDYAEKVYGKPFRFTSLELEPGSIPRKVLSIKICTP